jgi:Ca-activated chloride channel family protein
MTFATPLLLLTLLAIPAAAALYVLAQRRRMQYAIRFTNLDVLSQVVDGPSLRRWIPPVFFAVALGSLCVAVARPQAKTLVPLERATVILVIDASLSMQAVDVPPSRLGAAQEAVRTFLDRVPKRLRVGLVVFSGEAQVGAPPTTDHQLVRESVDAIGAFTGFGGTAIGDALVRAVELGRQALGERSLAAVGAAPRPSSDARGLVSILFLSDGRQNRGIVQPLDGARRARDAGMPVYTIALGTRNGRLPPGIRGQFGGSFGGVPFGGQPPGPRRLAPDPETLKAISTITGGEAFRATTGASLRAAYEKLGSRLGRKPAKREVTYAFLGGAVALLVAAGVLSALWSPRIP